MTTKVRNINHSPDLKDILSIYCDTFLKAIRDYRIENGLGRKNIHDLYRNNMIQENPWKLCPSETYLPSAHPYIPDDKITALTCDNMIRLYMNK